MYLSRVQIDVNNRQKIKDLTHLGAYHNWVEQSFPHEVDSGVRLRHLWRIDQLHGKQYLLVLSPDKPNLESLEKYGVPDSAGTKDYDQFLSRLSEGQEFKFRLTANPTHSVKEDGDKRGRVFPHVTAPHQMQWLVKQSEQAGFKINEIENSIDLDDEEGQEYRRLAFSLVARDQPILRHQGERIVHIRRVTFEGVLKITNLAKFKDVLTNGLGREKAYGMGLMTVIPVV